MTFTRVFVFIVAVAVCHVNGAEATEWFVAVGGNGDGTGSSPFGRIQDGLNAAQPGDTVTVRVGTYRESFRTIRAGAAGSPIRVRAEGARGTVIVTTAGSSVLRVDHPHVVVEGLVLDGQYAAWDTVDVNGGGDFFTLRNAEVRRSSKDLIDIGNPHDVVIERSLIHHALNAAGGRTDAHGIVAGAVQDLVIRDTEIHTFSGDGFQVDPGRSAPGWNRVTIERCRIWLAPLAAAENGFAAGVVPGENAIDTKASSSFARAVLTIRDTTAWGYRGGLIANMAAFNLKENIDVNVDGATVYDSEIAFRLRGPTSTTAGAWVTVKNAVAYNSTTAFRYENNIETLKLWNSTIGGNVTRAFQAASSVSTGLDIRNLLVLGKLPPEAADASNRGVGPESFVNAAAHNYTLAVGSAAIDAGIALPAVTHDRAGIGRPQGAAYDTGAYEKMPGAGDVVVYASNAFVMTGAWRLEPDPTAATGARLWHPNAGAPSLIAQASPTDYFDITVPVKAGKAYRLWIRGKADNNYRGNDAVWVQFSGSVKADGTAVYRIGTSSGTRVNIEDCSNCGLSAWGWQDNGYGVNVLGPLIRFARGGLQTLRVQTAEDGLSIDQIVLSPSIHLNSSPGALKNDTTILLEQ